MKPGQVLEVQLLYENRPLANAQLLAFSKKKLKTQLVQRTDADGRARFVLPHADIWMLSAVHMVPAPAAAPSRGFVLGRQVGRQPGQVADPLAQALVPGESAAGDNLLKRRSQLLE